MTRRAMKLSYSALPHRGIVFIATRHMYGITAPAEPREIYHPLINPVEKKRSSYSSVKNMFVVSISLRGSHGA
jgi:hypothetical protein